MFKKNDRESGVHEGELGTVVFDIDWLSWQPLLSWTTEAEHCSGGEQITIIEYQSDRDYLEPMPKYSAKSTN